MDTEALNIKNNLLSQLSEGKITMAEFDKECAYWYIKYYDTLHPLVFLTPRPKELQEYDSLTDYEKKQLPEKFWRQEEIYKYLEHKQKVITTNKGTLESLVRFKEYIPKEDALTIQKFDTLINEYRNTKIPEDLKVAHQIFGGKIERKDIDE